ncbi:hypothetical protein BGX38DRAFT_1163413, partial [Terfezia claveryi]
MAGVGWGWRLQNILLLFENSYLFALCGMLFFLLSVLILVYFSAVPFFALCFLVL